MGGQMTWKTSAAALVVALCACDEAQSKPATASSATSAPAENAPICNLDDVYRPAARPSVLAARTEAVVAMRDWSPECRMKALTLECEHTCSDEPSNLVLAAAPDDEARALRAERLKRNTAALQRLQLLVDKAEALHAYARKLPPAPRGLGDACMTRMRADFARVDAVQRELRTQLRTLPYGASLLNDWLVSVRSCLDCSDDRKGCETALTDREFFLKETIEHWRAQNAADASVLKP